VHEEGKFYTDKGRPKAFETIKSKLCSASILAFSKLELEVECDASGISIMFDAKLSHFICPFHLILACVII